VKCVDPFSDFKMQIPKMDKNFCPFSKCFTVYFSKKSEKITSYHNAVNPEFSKNVCYHTFFWGSSDRNGHFCILVLYTNFLGVFD
jgi:hypothetical protein